MYEKQSMEPDQEKRKKLVWEIDRRLQEDAARPMIFNYRLGTCRSAAVHGITIMVNSLFNGWRFEDLARPIAPGSGRFSGGRAGSSGTNQDRLRCFLTPGDVAPTVPIPRPA